MPYIVLGIRRDLGLVAVIVPEVALQRQLVLTGIYLWVSGSDAIGPLGIHVLGAPVGALVNLGDALIWIGAPPMLVLLGVLSNLGGFLHLPDC